MKIEDWMKILEEIFVKIKNSYESVAEIEESLKVFKDWAIDNEPSYVPVISFLLKGDIWTLEDKPTFCIEFPRDFHLEPYIKNENKTKTKFFTRIYDKNLDVLFQDIIKAIKVFKEEYGY